VIIDAHFAKHAEQYGWLCPRDIGQGYDYILAEQAPERDGLASKSDLPCLPEHDEIHAQKGKEAKDCHLKKKDSHAIYKALRDIKDNHPNGSKAKKRRTYDSYGKRCL